MPFLTLRTPDFYPLTLSMPLENMMFGLYSLRVRWNKVFENNPVLSQRWIEPTILPDPELLSAIKALSTGQVLKQDELVIAVHPNHHYSGDLMKNVGSEDLDKMEVINFEKSFKWIDSLQYMILHNKDQINEDWSRNENANNWFQPAQLENTFTAPGFHLSDVTIDDQEGPVILHKGATILPGARIKGPVVVFPHATVKMGAKLYPGCTIGRHVVVSGEIKNTIIHEYSSKGHNGYLGDSILGRWNNFGAGTTISNVANTFSNVRFKDWQTGHTIEYNTLKRGLITGDFVKLGVLSRTYRGTAIGSFCSIATNQPITGNIPTFTWWNEDHRTDYKPKDLRAHCQRQMALRNCKWTDEWERALINLIESRFKPQNPNLK
ncbi:hypothetical protein KUV50_04525 [Membranicola marinus]|uniref:UDP-N-acetylglucosamine diphosphorylase/glucosamine-1-phosphate N-acetyltransferase n=1 Tax=Membranihabitans marinus TaxID=1227546 RepID=A0A953L875_9BACT|nr:putative sugar nucleotidyl transferase [Membranihabitans marinus]MBY5957390.1 hypothetical protein [Membranihabitans marinus]